MWLGVWEHNSRARAFYRKWEFREVGQQIFQLGAVSSAFGVDVFISSLVLWLFVFSQGKKQGMKNLWCYVLCNLLFGVSSALPLFLYFRERTIKHADGQVLVPSSVG